MTDKHEENNKIWQDLEVQIKIIVCHISTDLTNMKNSSVGQVVYQQDNAEDMLIEALGNVGRHYLLTLIVCISFKPN